MGDPKEQDSHIDKSFRLSTQTESNTIVSAIMLPNEMGVMLIEGQQEIDVNSNLTLRQQSRMRSFKHLVGLVHDYQAKIDNHETWSYFTKDEEGKEVKLPINQMLINNLRLRAFHMYEGFRTDLSMAVSADEFLDSLNQNKVAETSSLEAMWETGADEII